MSGSDFEVKGLDDLSEKLLSAIEEFPGTTEKGLVTLGNKLKKECVKNHAGRQHGQAEERLEA